MGIARKVLKGWVAATAVALAASGLTASPAHAIIGGNATTADAHPYYVRIGKSVGGHKVNDGHCGGSVISAEWILTAAHCVNDMQVSEIDVWIRDKTRYTALERRIHPLWDGEVVHGPDHAQVRVPSDATSGVTPVQVGVPGDSGPYQAGRYSTIVGHGRTHQAGTWTAELRSLSIPIRSDSDMESIYNKWYTWGFADNWVESLMIGAGSTYYTICNGDSGGPLTTWYDNRLVQVGVASFGDGTWDKCDEPGGYAELRDAQMAWITTNVPAIKQRWGTCYSGGRSGTWQAYYSTTWNSVAARDGAYYWYVYCLTSGGTPSPTPRPPSPEICEAKPWTTGCENY